MSSNLVIIDYGMGNLGSISNMIKHIGYSSIISSEISKVKSADKIILPGVGHFDRAMTNIKSLGLYDIIKHKATKEKIPILGICLGMQIMCENSEEGSEIGLNLINANVRRFSFKDNNLLKIPHMGWNYTEQIKDSPLLSQQNENPRYYFVHSYHVVCNDVSDVLTTTNYGYKFVSSFQKDNIVGVQFHPEKSHKYGMSLFRNFIEIL